METMGDKLKAWQDALNAFRVCKAELDRLETAMDKMEQMLLGRVQTIKGE